jgi:serine phosphatase RsbU (regulator of sigma subunit)
MQMNKTTRIFAWITGILFLTGAFFKLNHLPAASIQLVLAAFLYIFFYLPLWLAARLKGKEFKFFYFAQYLMLTVFMLSSIAKIQHWPLSTAIFYIGVLVLLTVFLPALIFKNKKSGSAGGENIHITLILLLFTVIFYIFQSGQVSKGLLFSMTQGGSRTEVSLKNLHVKSDKLYQSLELLSDKATNSNYRKARALKLLTDSTETYINHLRSYLISRVDKISIEKADSTPNIRINDPLNYDTPTHELLQKPGRYSAQFLKKKIELFRDSSIRLVDNEQQSIISQGINLSTANIYDPETDADVSWENFTFYHIPLNGILSSLSSLKYEIKNAETQILTNLLNNASATDKTNLAAQIAELGVKYESQKKEQQLVLMQKDKELFNAKMQEKQDSVDSLNTTLTCFILALVGFAVMLFYIIRSNLVRKKLNTELALQKAEAEKQRELVEEKQHEIIDSITYAKRLQQAILPSVEAVRENLAESFIYYKPKDIVAGDFYWMHTSAEYVYLAAADCTGHGVPGAMVSVVCSNALNRAVNEFKLTDTNDILNKTRELVIETFEKSDSEVKDGMDISLLRIPKKRILANTEIEWSGANNSLWYVLGGELLEVKADKQPIGKHSDPFPFTSKYLSVSSPVTFYLFSDGYADQFSPEDKKLMKKKFKDIVLTMQTMSLSEQRNHLETFHTNWKGNMEQTDDVLVIGVKL